MPTMTEVDMTKDINTNCKQSDDIYDYNSETDDMPIAQENAPDEPVKSVSLPLS